MNLSNYALEKMGFTTLPDGETISGMFHSSCVYEVRGFTLDAGALDPHSGSISGTPYKFCVGSSLNQISQKLCGIEYADNEEEWQKEHKCTPPYLMILFGPTKEYQGSGRYFQVIEGIINTYDSFGAAKTDLEAQENRALPSLLSALACQFALREPKVSFLPTDRVAFGTAKDGKTILDRRLTGSITGYVSRRYETEEVQALLAEAPRFADGFDVKVARFYHLALNETDPLKRFLYFFQAIEIQTHATFASIDRKRSLSKVVALPERAADSAKVLFGERRENWPALKDRFVWCVLCVWTQLSDSDVAELRRLKDVRDKIAHGSIAAPDAASVADVEKLATKLQLGRP